MADSEALKIAININSAFAADGAKAALSSVDELGKATAKTGAAQSAFEKDLEKVEHRAGGVSGQTREMYRAFYAIDRIAPGLGETLRGSLEEGGLAIAGLLISLEMLEDVFKEMEDISAIQQANFEGDAKAILAVKAAYDQLDSAARIFVEDLIRQNAAGQTADAVASRQIANFKALASAQTEYNAAQQKLGEAEIDQQEKNGVITHQQALSKKFALDVEYAKKRLLLEAQVSAQEVKAKEQQLNSEKRQLAAALEDRKTDLTNDRSATGAKAKAEHERTAANTNITNAEDTLKELGKSHGSIVKGQIDDDTVQELTKYYEKYVGASKNVSLTDQFLSLANAKGSLMNKASWDLGLTNLLVRQIGNQNLPALEKYQGAKDQIEGSKKILAQLDKNQFDVDLNAERGKKQLDATDAEISKLTKSVNELANSLPQIKADAGAKLNNDAATSNLNLRADAVAKGLADPGNVFRASSQPVATTSWPSQPTGTSGEAPPANPRAMESRARSDFGLLEDYAEKVRGGGHLDERQTQVLRGMVTALNGHTANNKELQAALDAVLASNRMRDQILVKFQAALSQQSVQISRLQGGQ